MSASQVCPQCGASLLVNAPGGLCPRCLMSVALGPTQTFWMDATDDAGDEHDRDTLVGPSSESAETIRPTTPVDLDQFKRAVQELGLIRVEEFERFVAGALGGVPGLAGALVRAGKLTPYQARALAQGKSRGLVIGNYFILDKLGEGGMGVVFKARHRRLGRVVALKILPPSLARDRDLLSRFRREVDVAARLSHPNIVSVLDADEDRGVQFMTMDYVQGNDLDRLVRAGGVLPVDLALDCVIQAARGLEAAHAQGIVHRDIKPGNLMLDGSGQVRVLDLGLARLVEASNPFDETTTGPLTRSGTYMGTVDFMAPEQGIDSRRVDHRADIYSLGCTLCYLLTGRAPFEEGANVLSRLMAHQDRAPASLLAARPDVPRSIDGAYQKMMAKKPDDRPATMNAVIALLEACRTSTNEAETARLGLKTLSETIVMNRASPRKDVGHSPVAKSEAPAAVQIGKEESFKDVLLDDRDKRSPAKPMVVSEPALHPKPTGSSRIRKPARSRTPAFALGAIALLALGAFGYALKPRPASVPVAALIPDRSSGHEQRSRSGPLPPTSTEASPPRSATTFDVMTIYMPRGYDGRVADKDGTLLSPTTTGSRLQIPFSPPPKYRIDLEVEPLGKDADYVFALGPVISGRQTEIVIDRKLADGGRGTGLDGLDGVPLDILRASRVHSGQLLSPSQPTHFVLTVRRGSINLACDGTNVVSWKGDPKRFIRYLRWHIPDSKALFLATTSPVKFHKMTLTPLTAASP